MANKLRSAASLGDDHRRRCGAHNGVQLSLSIALLGLSSTIRPRVVAFSCGEPDVTGYRRCRGRTKYLIGL